MPEEIETLAKRRSDLVRQLMASNEDLPPMSSSPDRADTDYARNLLAADVTALEAVLLVDLADPEDRHSN
ncbi:hypothetical protein [Streptomyces sp. NPDC051546]|uniref:hypothetical protein n=1 Tax=Streptomyces sp. NPDC051546 TaxID=3365655 RepID=UPI00379B57F0